MNESNSRTSRTVGGAHGTPLPDPALIEPGVTLLHLANGVLRRRRLVTLAPLAIAFAVAAFVTIRAREYTSTASFMAQPADAVSSRFSGIAAQLGGTLMAPGGAHTPAFYADLLKSRELLRQLVLTQYSIAAAPKRFGMNDREEVNTGNLVVHLNIKSDDEAVAREKAVDKLRDIMHVTVSRDVGLVNVSVTSHNPELSAGIVSESLRLIGEFNLRVRQTRASEERSFVEERVAQAREELTASEDALKTFLQENRAFTNAPELEFEHDRLKRDVSIKQQVFNTLAQAFEQARIDEVRNTPVITLVERPIAAPRPDPRGLFLKVLAAWALSFIAIVSAIAVLEIMAIGRSTPGDNEAIWAFEALSREAWAEVAYLTRIVNPFGRRKSRV